MIKNSNIKNTKHLFEKLNISKNTLSSKQKKDLLNKGFIIIPPTIYMKKNIKILNLMTKKLIKKEGKKGGWEGKEKYYKKGKLFEKGTNRLGNLINKHKVFQNLITIPEILAASYEVVKSDIKIAGVNLRSPLKNNGKQRIHMDWKPREKKSQKYAGVVCFVFIDAANKANGALRIIPGSHKKNDWPEKYIDVHKKNKNEITAVVKPGTIIVANLNLWHAGAENYSGKERKMIMINIKRRNLPQLINYKKYLSKTTVSQLDHIKKYLLAVRKIDKTQKSDSIGVGKYYKNDFYLDKKIKR